MDRWIVVDNADSGLSYSGAWSSVSGAPYDPHGNFGRTYRTNLQSLTSGQGTISYTFQGTSGRVYGTNNIEERNGNIDPTWSCALDGRPLQMPNSFPYAENNWILCEFSGVSDGTHTITITARSNGRAFLFDYFIYTPSSSRTLTNVVTGVGWRDSAVQYDSGWDQWGGAGFQGKEPGGTLTFPFYGTGITFMGLTPIEGAPGETEAEYFIDSQSPVRFTVPGRDVTTHFHRVFFRSGSVPLGHHTLTVVYRGNTGRMPLVLTNFFVESSTFPPPAARSPTTVGNGGNTNAGGGGGGGASNGGNTSGAGSGGGASGLPANPPTPTGTQSSGGGNGTFGSLPTGPGSPLQSTASVTRVVTTTAADGSVRTTAIVTPANVTGVPPADLTGQSANGSGSSWSAGSNDNTIFLGDGSSSHKAPIGAIIGGVLGAMAIAGIFVLAILMHRASAKRKRKQQEEFEGVEKLEGHVQPFEITSSVNPHRVLDNSLGESNSNPFIAEHYRGGKGAIVIAGGYAIQRGSPFADPSDGSSNEGSSNTTGEGNQLQHTRAEYSKREEARREAQAQGSSSDGVVLHSDSGYRLPVQPQIASSRRAEEYPPLYTAA
ncbi:hypothetical protein CVT24_011035 [Panaeolus cyanescens]|uniref:Uncharacterized protein n=1 Tax=Panaeolus cyanescens TaxID=181874 RepID=A0A409VFY5_9AGAR|nr:hypothetical protein CVT24_011035 [Panaeolus cyanescens]